MANDGTFCKRSNNYDIAKTNNIARNNIDESENNTDPCVNKVLPMDRDAIVARRKLKVAARKQIKKLEKSRTNQMTLLENVEKPSFSLQLASEEFPTLNATKTKKKHSPTFSEANTQRKQHSVLMSAKDENSGVPGAKFVEKSWKPKVKDPIRIDLNQALLTKSEKHKPVLKRVDQPNLPPCSGNILDSDNPTRRKGKVRPDKVQKPSKLKSIILNERKKKLLEIGETNLLLGEKAEHKTEENNTMNRSLGLPDSNVGQIESKVNFVCTKTEIKPNENEFSCSESEKILCIPTYHSRRFREYCTNCLTEELITSVCGLLEKVAYFQDRTFAREPIKANAKRRYVAGINQVNKYLQVKKVKLLVIAPDLERNSAEGGLDEKVNKFKMEAEAQDVPCVFGPNRKRLGKAVKKNTLVSCVAVLSYEGAEELYSQVLEALCESKIKYLRLTGTPREIDDQVSNEVPQGDESDVTSSLLAVLREELPGEKLLSSIHRVCGAAETESEE